MSSNGPGSIDTSNLISGELSNWLIENAPVIDSPEELCFYGFKKIKNDESFFVDSPIGYWPVIPVYVGTEYSNRIRGGLYIEHHNPIHMWSPTSVSAATSGFILTMIPISPVSLGWDGGWRGTNPLPPAFGDYKVAKIHIQFGETLISHNSAPFCTLYISRLLAVRVRGAGTVVYGPLPPLHCQQCARPVARVHTQYFTPSLPSCTVQ